MLAQVGVLLMLKQLRLILFKLMMEQDLKEITKDLGRKISGFSYILKLDISIYEY